MNFIAPFAALSDALPIASVVGGFLPPWLDRIVDVLLALGSLWGLLEMTRWGLRRVRGTPPARAAAPATPVLAQPVAPAPAIAVAPVAPAVPPPAAPTALATPPLPVTLSQEHIMALIAAAVHLTFEGRRYRIASATVLEPDLYWAREGRRWLLASHKTR